MEISLTVDSGASYHMFSRCALSTFLYCIRELKCFGLARSSRSLLKEVFSDESHLTGKSGAKPEESLEQLLSGTKEHCC